MDGARNRIKGGGECRVDGLKTAVQAASWRREYILDYAINTRWTSLAKRQFCPVCICQRNVIRFTGLHNTLHGESNIGEACRRPDKVALI